MTSTSGFSHSDAPDRRDWRDYRRIAPGGYRAFAEVHAYVAQSGLQSKLLHLIYLRISQLNSCAFCIDLHWRDALAAGVPARKLNLVCAWRETSLFDGRERAALAWAETLTRLIEDMPDETARAEVHAVFSEEEVVNLTYAVALMNGFNRLGTAFQQPPDMSAKVQES